MEPGNSDGGPAAGTGGVAGLLAAVERGVRIVDLGHPMFTGMPQSSRHPSFDLVVPRRHGDAVRPDGSSGANDLIITGSHVGTHIDALAHISQDGRLHGGVDAAAAQSSGRFSRLGVETVAPFFCRGVLLDLPGAKGVDELPGGYEVTVADLEEAAEHTGQRPGAGCVVLTRTGWGRRWPDPASYEGAATGVPGIGEAAARWLASFQPRAAGIDTIAFDRVPVAGGVDPPLPAHRVLIVEHGIHLIEQLALEELAALGVAEFLFVLSPLKLVGATGSPARPLAVLEAGP